MKAEFQGNEPVYGSSFFAVLAIQAAFGVTYSTFLLLPKFLRVDLGASAAEIGWINGALGISGAAFAPLLGVLGMRLPKKRMLLLGLLAASLSSLGFAQVTHLGPLALTMRFLQGFAWAAVSNTTSLFVSEMVPPHKLAQSIGYLGLSVLATNALAPALAEPLAAAYGFRSVFACVGAFAGCALLLLTLLPKEEPTITNSSQLPTSGWDAIGRRALAACFVTFCMGVGIGVMFTFPQPYALELGAHRVGDFFLGYVAAAVFVRTFLAKLTDRLGAARVVPYATTTYAIVVGLTALMRPSWLIALGVGIGASHGFLYPASTAMGLEELPERSRPLYFGLYNGAFNVGFAGSLLILGPIADRQGYPLAFLLGAFCMLTAVPVVRRYAPALQ